MTYAFIRHGQTDWNAADKLQGSSDIPLNDTGRRQAHEAAEILRDGGWAAIVSSPLSRARETAEIIAADLGLELGPAYDELVERDYGVLEGTSATDATTTWPDRTYPGAETLAEVVARGRAGLERIAADYPAADVVIVCHGTIIRYTLADLAGAPMVGIRNGAVSTFEHTGDGAWRVLTVNSAPYVAEDERDSVSETGLAG